MMRLTDLDEVVDDDTMDIFYKSEKYPDIPKYYLILGQMKVEARDFRKAN